MLTLGYARAFNCLSLKGTGPSFTEYPVELGPGRHFG
jgi:hypothetical protein